VPTASMHTKKQCSNNNSNKQNNSIDWVKILRFTRHEIGYFGDVLPSQSLVEVLKEIKHNKSKQYKNKMTYANIKTITQMTEPK